jgi:hypothetical protein
MDGAIAEPNAWKPICEVDDHPRSGVRGEFCTPIRKAQDVHHHALTDAMVVAGMGASVQEPIGNGRWAGRSRLPSSLSRPLDLAPSPQSAREGITLGDFRGGILHPH